ncbi:MAG TPA: gamma-glutamylputrescine oxidoreductase, partial [Rhodospirillaceae bacterium]|nr:gamma-glutamylputrescine oxidoreductase [Rhodospirillaceae bacterium]
MVDHVASYYAATANASPGRPPLMGDISADVCVIGAGYSGLSTALTLAEAGRRVVVLEAAKVGWGASGRNGGQIIPGWRKGASELIAKFGAGQAK